MAITSPPLIPSSPANPTRFASYRSSFAAQLVHEPDPSQSPSPFSPPPFPTSAAAASDLRRPRSLTRIGTVGSHRWSHPLPAIAHDGAPVWTVTPTTASAALATSSTASSLAATAPLTALTPTSSAALTSPGSRPLTSPMRTLLPPAEPMQGVVNVTGGVNQTGGVHVIGVNALESMRGSVSVGTRPLTSPRPSPRPYPPPNYEDTQHPHPPTSPTSTISQLLHTTGSCRKTHPSAAEYQKERALARQRAEPPIPPSLTRAMVPEVCTYTYAHAHLSLSLGLSLSLSLSRSPSLSLSLSLSHSLTPSHSLSPSLSPSLSLSPQP